ncbi:YhcB family protein [Marinospirillum alkaliphilum]|uniref:Z-ring associated protein G n=1 Tax=Marinospirillum alkaliphilum DSM 21637 TaxID=1122209 RepID=A0A1K1TQK3_9GAMM|nr:DUF1043 family protein [Marinospirillum alkaliphilum]SFX02549.1 hypothetical protein SAMN02745752_00260 [Marinospirillum alkaliphilum DSM 21637]
MTFADIQWVYVITAFLIGAGLGALAYHLMNSSVANSIRIRHQLTERELELNQLKESLNDHFARTADGLSSMSKQLKDMEDQLLNDAGRLCSDEGVIKKLTNTNEKTSKTQSATTTEESLVEPPRDYASDKARGTLSEDFGLKPEVFEPPRN